MNLDLLITNAVVVNANGSTRAEVGIKDGKIAALFSPEIQELPQASRTIDAAGMLLIPGGVDGHCHVEQVTGSYKSKDTFATATIAALHGGTTTIIDFGIPSGPEESPLEAIENKMRLIEGARCDVALHGAVIKWDESIPAQLEALINQGVVSVKLYTTNRGTTMADDDTILNVMKEMVRLGGLTYIHAEHDAIIFDRTTSWAESGKVDIKYLAETRPVISEEASVREILSIAEYTGAPVLFVHQTTPEAVAAVQEAREQGQPAFSETCPHYLMLNDSEYGSEHPEKFACCPPLRPPAKVSKLRELVMRGHVDVISSDHSCYDLAQKHQWSSDVRMMPHGLPGVETRMPAAFTALVIHNELSLERFVDLFATAPARINGLTTKGVIDVGYDADLVLFDPNTKRTVNEDVLHQGTDFSPFDGITLQGWPSTVICAGRIVLEEGTFIDPGPVGGYRRRTRSSKPGVYPELNASTSTEVFS